MKVTEYKQIDLKGYTLQGSEKLQFGNILVNLYRLIDLKIY